MKVKGVLLIAVVAVLNVLIIVHPSVALDAAGRGLMLWFHSFLPGVLPFVIGANVLMALGAVGLLGRFLSPVMRGVFRLPGSGGFAVAMGLVSGYPIGAKIVCEMRTGGVLNKNEAQRLLGFVNNAGPLFILGAVAVGMFGSAQLGYLLLVGHYTGAVALGLLLRIFAGKRGRETPVKPVFAVNQPFGQILGVAVKNAMETMVLVGGFIVLFSVISALIMHIAGDVLAGGQFAVAGVFEMTGGLGLLSENAVTRHVAAAAGAILGFGGLSILFQALSFVGKTDLSPTLYVLCKIAHGVLAGAATFLLYPFFARSIETAVQPAFAPSATRVLINSSTIFVATIAVLLAICSVIFIIGKFRSKRN